MAKKLTMHVITGTHWDREWRHTAEQSKLRLMDLIDSILEILDNDPEYNSFITVDNDKIVLAAIKCAEDKSGYIVRLWNKSDEDVNANIKINLPVTSAKLVKMNEEEISDIEMNNGEMLVQIEAHKIVTIKLK